MKFQGIRPTGEGLIVEVHVDLLQRDERFHLWLQEQGFEDDPFTLFHPAGYTNHMTGRVTALRNTLRVILDDIRTLIREVIHQGVECEADCYVELEIVRDTTRFHPYQQLDRFLPLLDSFRFVPSGRYGGAKADIHVEFQEGHVSEEVRSYLLDRQFYWVATPETLYFGPEEIATLQTDTFHSGKVVYEQLVKCPLLGCKAIHLEQKLLMMATKDDLPMPQVISVISE